MVAMAQQLKLKHQMEELHIVGWLLDIVLPQQVLSQTAWLANQWLFAVLPCAIAHLDSANVAKEVRGFVRFSFGPFSQGFNSFCD